MMAKDAQSAVLTARDAVSTRSTRLLVEEAF